MRGWWCGFVGIWILAVTTVEPVQKETARAAAARATIFQIAQFLPCDVAACDES